MAFVSYGGIFFKRPSQAASENEQACPNAVLPIRNRHSVLLMDHSDNAGGISISGQWDDMK